MIARLPFDRGLPELPTLFDGDAMAELLSGHLDPRASSTVERCEPRYVRYKPQTSCIVQYDLQLRAAGSDLISTTAYVKSFADSSAANRATSEGNRRRQQRATAVHGDSPMPRVAVLPRVNGLLQVFPIDDELRFMVRASDARKIRWAFRKHSPDLQGVTVRVVPELVRYKPERKALFRYQIEGGPVDSLYGKVHSTDRIARYEAHSRAFATSGLNTPPVLAAIPKHCFIAHAAAEGEALTSLRGSDSYAGWMEPLAAMLAHIQAVRVPDAPVAALTDIALELTAMARWLGVIVPHMEQRLDGLCSRLIDGLTELAPCLVTCHGDFYDDQVLVSERGLTIIDLDEVRASHPLLDPGNMLAHLSVVELRDGQLDAARDALHDAVVKWANIPARGLKLFETVGILKLAADPLRHLEPDWPDRIERIVSLAEERLAPGSIRTSCPNPAPSNGQERAIIADADLPQLRTLQDREAMSLLLTSNLTEPFTNVTRIDMVRLKPGRRAILRYQIEHPARSRVVFGKTFASDRGQRVYEIVRSIALARAFGGDVAVPEPVAFVPQLKLLLQGAVSGTAIEKDLLEGNAHLARTIATVVHQFHTSELELARSHDVIQELAPLAMRVEEVARANQELGLMAEACLKRIDAVHVNGFQWRYQPVHRDFYHDQLLIDGSRLAVLDLDDATMSEPLVDVANFAAHLRLLCAQKPRHALAIEEAERAFIGQYRQLDDGYTRDLMGFLTTTTLVRLAGIHISRANGKIVARQLLQEASSLLREAQ